jgi:hypothetical protein
MSSEFNPNLASRVKNSLPSFPPSKKGGKDGDRRREEGMRFLLIYRRFKLEH